MSTHSPATPQPDVPLPSAPATGSLRPSAPETPRLQEPENAFSHPPSSFWHPSDAQRIEDHFRSRDERTRERQRALGALDEELKRLRARPLPRPASVTRYVLYFIAFMLLLSTRDVRILYFDHPPILSLQRLYSSHVLDEFSNRLLGASPEESRTLALYYDLASEDLERARRVMREMANDTREWRPGLLDWGIMLRFGFNRVLLFEYTIFLSMLYAAGLASVLYLRNRDITNSRLIDRQNRELSILTRRKAIEVAETSALLRDLHRAQTRVISSEKLASVGRLSATLAHEIRNPLGIIASSVGMVAEDFAPESPQGQALGFVRAEIHRLNKIITDLLAFARPRKPDLAFHDLNELIRSWTPPVQEELAEKNIQVLADLDPALPEVCIDANQLYQAFLNLVINSADALDSRGGGQIMISTRPRDTETVQLEVRDDGEGIAPEHLAQVFEPFFTTKTNGTGLGLAVVKQAVESMGGNIEIESKRGEGAFLRLLLPVESSQADPRSEAAASASAEPAVAVSTTDEPASG